MEINLHRLEQDFFSSSHYRVYELDWLLGRNKTDVYRLINKLLKPEVQEDFAKRYTACIHYSPALAFANWLLVRMLNDKQLLQYVMTAVEQILPLLKRDYPPDTILQGVN